MLSRIMRPRQEYLKVIGEQIMAAIDRSFGLMK